jgi:ABC-type glycerol-3-phosphate transport system substrate-binding protein
MAASLSRPKQDLVWKFMELVASPRWQEQYSILSAAPAARVGAVTQATADRLPHVKLIQDAAAEARSTFGATPEVRANYNEFAAIFGRAMMRLISTQEPTAQVLAGLQRDLERAIPRP